jgi:hypothetical protein
MPQLQKQDRGTHHYRFDVLSPASVSGEDLMLIVFVRIRGKNVL